MPFYFLDVMVGERLKFEDDIGADFASLDDARDEALDALAEIVGAQVAQSGRAKDVSIIIRDRTGGEALDVIRLTGPKNDN